MNTFGDNLRLTVFGESHGPGVGMVLDGFPAGIEVDMDYIYRQLSRRAPGMDEMGSARDEADEPVFLSGVFSGYTDGAPICAVMQNKSSDSSNYYKDIPRPGHADLAAMIKYSGFSDHRGGGAFSGRLTTPLVLAGALCGKQLEQAGITVLAKLVQVGAAKGDGLDVDMRKAILDVRAGGDSVGSVVECVAEGVPAGLGGMMFGGMESRISSILFAIPGVKGVEFGSGFELAAMWGSQANDPIRIENGRVYTETNNSGGINGGITNGMPVVVRAALRPTPSISREQKTVNMATMENVDMRFRGRFDACLGPRAIPVIEAAVAFCLLDALMGN